jgi:hypothetical protein
VFPSFGASEVGLSEPPLSGPPSLAGLLSEHPEPSASPAAEKSKANVTASRIEASLNGSSFPQL